MTIQHRALASTILPFLALLTFIAPSSSRAGEKVEERLRAEAPGALANLEASLTNLECRGSIAVEINDHGPSKCGDYRLKLRGADTLLIQAENISHDARPSPFRRLIYGTHGKEHFLLREADDGSLSNPYPEGSQGPREIADNERRQWVEGLARGYFGGGRTLPALLDDPDFRMTRVAEEDRDGLVHVRVEFEHRRQSDTTQHTDRGSFLMAPHLHWAFREFERRTESRPDYVRTSYRQVFDLSGTPEGFPVVRKASYDLKAEGALNWSQRGDLNLREWAYRVVPEAEFRAETYKPTRE